MTSKKYSSDNFLNSVVRIIFEYFSAGDGMSEDLYKKLSDLDNDKDDKDDLTIKDLEFLGLHLDGVKFLYQIGKKGVLPSKEDAKTLEEKFFHMNPN
ncbi:MAG: hypothetical protein US31_C0017G0001 [Berkelbacteria bacterium GW2011_GWA1_36_9]|uniref:Uncharacterized protein n=1 Tax=Berkelbacteria bacterium GW2011_GWA1_36_9 TaxID=1618331 RepID=A0A0G0FII6_9BACT|nr:MAG: hypothetical protein US31_C0017G0001 [Berkelbacteria bacterium GW2011_GWA1_36_9]